MRVRCDSSSQKVRIPVKVEEQGTRLKKETYKACGKNIQRDSLLARGTLLYDMGARMASYAAEI